MLSVVLLTKFVASHAKWSKCFLCKEGWNRICSCLQSSLHCWLESREFQFLALAPFQRWFPACWLEGRHLVLQHQQEHTAQMGPNYSKWNGALCVWYVSLWILACTCWELLASPTSGILARRALCMRYSTGDMQISSVLLGASFSSWAPPDI